MLVQRWTSNKLLMFKMCLLGCRVCHSYKTCALSHNQKKYSFARAVVYYFVRLFILLVYSFVRLLVCLHTNYFFPFMQSFIYLLIFSFIHLLSLQKPLKQKLMSV